MGRYILKFSKLDDLKYISHLDLLRVFLRLFNRAGIALKYSNGFNPHAKVGFALPLSLGFESTGEYIELETRVEYTAEELLNMISTAVLPGIAVTDIRSLAETSKTAVAAALTHASYHVTFADSEMESGEGLPAGRRAAKLEAALKPFLDQNEIISVRFNRKKKKDVETDLRPLIHSASTARTAGGLLVFSLMLRTGSNGNLNAEVFMEELCRFAGIEYIRTDFTYRRTEMYMLSGRNLVPLIEFEG